MFLAFAGFLKAAEARVVLISDVDDTIRVSHVRDKFKLLIRGAARNEAFTGMAELYALVRSMPEGAQIYYVSNKVQKLEDTQKNFPAVTHEKMLADNRFPDAENLRLRDSSGYFNNDREQKYTHKMTAVQQIVANALVDLPAGDRLEIVMIGDNGEDDPKVYADSTDLLRSKLTAGLRPRVRIHQLIRNIYGAEGQAIRKDQLAFATAGELALLLARGGLFSDAQKRELGTFVNSIPTNFSNHSKEAPKWVNCSNHPFEQLRPLANDAQLASSVATTYRNLQKLCLRNGENR